ncbi:DegT/DnrJ/EryC1/StrS family aminotransferase, partial [Frankia sp. CNm7]
RLLGTHGSERRYVHETLGFNSRLDTVQAVVLRAKLTRLDRWNAARRAVAARYDTLLEAAGLTGTAWSPGPVRPPTVAPGNIHVWHLYVIRIPDRDAVLARLNKAGIGAGIHYQLPVHLQEAFASLGYARGDFPVAERACAQILSLPIHPHLTEADQARVVDELAEALA